MKSFSLTALLALACVAAVSLQHNGVDHPVSIQNKQYSPANVSVRVGDTVTWTNNDDHDHTVVADDGSFKSGNIGAGQTFQYRFKKPGQYSYSCQYHPRMKGNVSVTQ